MTDVNQKLQKMLVDRGWSEYRLSKESGLSESTIANIFKRNNVPTIATLEAICSGFGITLSQFFTDGEMVELTYDLKVLFESWRPLSKAQKEAAIKMLQAMNQKE